MNPSMSCRHTRKKVQHNILYSCMHARTHSARIIAGRFLRLRRLTNEPPGLLHVLVQRLALARRRRAMVDARLVAHLAPPPLLLLMLLLPALAPCVFARRRGKVGSVKRRCRHACSLLPASSLCSKHEDSGSRSTTEGSIDRQRGGACGYATTEGQVGPS